MTVRKILRTVAILIAIAAMVDPAWSTNRPEAGRLIAIDLADGDAADTVAALRAALPRWEVERREATSLAIPCAADERCVLMADGSTVAPLPADLTRPPSLLVINSGGEPNSAIRSAVTATANIAAAGVIRVELERAGPIAESAIVVRDGAAVVGSALHKWSDGDRATVDVPWWPLDGGARTLRVEATPADGEATTVDNALDVGVQVRRDRVRVLIFDARPSWSSTFVRRALEDDSRLQVEHRARVAPALTAGTKGTVLDAASLDAVPAVIVGEPDALTEADVVLLERFVRLRGGSLVLLPERRISGPALRLLQGEWSEHLVAAPEQVGPLQASEILRARDLPATALVLAQSGSAPSIVSLPTGHGRVVVSGAMDAWRFRAAAFDDFWRSVAVEAGRAGAALRIDIADTLAPSAARVPFVIRYRSFDPRPALDVSVRARCGDEQATPVRVWPTGAGEFSGELPVSEGGCELQALAGDRTATASIAVAAHPARGVQITLSKLERSIAEAGGTAYTVGGEAALAAALAESSATASRDVSIRPMRETFWLFAFTACLAAEWWLRRREGSA